MTGLIVFSAKYLFAVVPLIVLLVFWKAASEERRAMLLRGGVVMLLAVALAKGGGAIYNESRPFVVHHIAPLIPHEADNGFPSDHTLVTFACAFLMLPFSRRGAGIAILIAAAVGFARIACSLHSPLDIVASVLMAAVANLIAWKAVRVRPISEPA